MHCRQQRACWMEMIIKNHRVHVGGYRTKMIYNKGIFIVIMAEDTPLKIATGTCSIGGFILFIFTCIALYLSDKEVVYVACGHSLRNSVLVNLLSVIIFSLVFCLLFLKSCCDINARSFLILVLASITFFFMGILSIGSWTIHESRIAAQNPNCTSALSMDSVSANLKTPLLIHIGLVNGSIMVIASLVLYVVTILFVCKKLAENL